jgi:hypothetical protein
MTDLSQTSDTAMSLEQLKKLLAENPLGYFKYVRVGDEFRFMEGVVIGLTHSGLQGTDTASGAGWLKTYPDGMFIEGYSLTLNMGPGPGDEELLSELLGLPIKDRW